MLKKFVGVFNMKIKFLLFGLLINIVTINTDVVYAGENMVAVTPHALPVKIMFIHHSVGGHWLAHDYGGLVNELNSNNFYVNDVTYGWEPQALTDSVFKKIKRRVLAKVKRDRRGAYGIGNRTDIGHMPEWFLGSDSDLIMSAIYTENRETDLFGDHSNNTSRHPLVNPDLKEENQIIMYKSCFPNTLFRGKAQDSANKNIETIGSFAAGSKDHTVANVKRVFNDLLVYFGKQPDKFFVIITPPPQIELPENGRVARAFSNWLVHDWLAENRYSLANVFIFDLYNVLTSKKNDGNSDVGEESGNHHRIWHGNVQHVVQKDQHTLVYPLSTGDNHPSPAGLRKATKEFVPLLIYYHAQWKKSLSVN